MYSGSTPEARFHKQSPVAAISNGLACTTLTRMITVRKTNIVINSALPFDIRANKNWAIKRI
jgi:hypothetical protein